MPKKHDDANITFVDALPGPDVRGKWVTKLGILIEHQNRLALIETFETPTQARDAQSNLHRRIVNMPRPDDEWFFAARGCELYAKYIGPTKKAVAARHRRGTKK